MGLVGRWKQCRGQGGFSGKPLLLFPEAMLKPDQLVGEVPDTFPSATTSILCEVFSQGRKILSPREHISVHFQSC